MLEKKQSLQMYQSNSKTVKSYFLLMKYKSILFTFHCQAALPPESLPTCCTLAVLRRTPLSRRSIKISAEPLNNTFFLSFFSSFRQTFTA